MSFTRLAVPVALGLSLVTVTAVVVYYVFKKDDDETSGKAIKTSRVNVIEVSVPKTIVPALIGRGGSNIKELEKKSGAIIHFKKFSDKDYDVCIIRGRSEATQVAETFIHDFIKNQPVIVEDTLKVPAWACGRIIGTGGDNINDISHRSGARVKVEGTQFSDNLFRQITFRGSKEQIEVAKGLVESIVNQEKCRREIEQSKRSPRNAQPATSPILPNKVEPNAETNLEPNELPGDAHKHASKKTEASGSSIEVYVSAVSSPSRFWVQFVGPQVAQLDDLVEQMTEYYNNKDNRSAHALRTVSVGQVVAAVFRHDGRWYRARIADIKPNEFDPTQQVADVFYVDYGDSEYVATHELCELRADLLRLRFQAMECFLAGVRPAGSEEQVVAVSAGGHRWDRWDPQAVERFEELTQVARWKALVSKTCSYKKSATPDGEKEKEIPGIKLYDVTEEGEVDIGGVLISEGWAVPATPHASPRASPARPPFGDLGNSRVLGMLNDRGERSASLPKDHERSDHSPLKFNGTTPTEEQKMPSSKSLGSGLESSDQTKAQLSNLSYPETSKPMATNGTHEDFLQAEREHAQRHNTENLPNNSTASKQRDDLKANMNRIDSHHGNLEALSRSHDLH